MSSSAFLMRSWSKNICPTWDDWVVKFEPSRVPLVRTIVLLMVSNWTMPLLSEGWMPRRKVLSRLVSSFSLPLPEAVTPE
ncbi:hypothetical protein KC342_g40 [Hortaea werneckii]|nr:hypothetical protein KC342_g40 [Hortaea werneckii]